MSRISALSAHGGASWEDRLATIVATMREMSMQTDPQEMVNAYAARMRELLITDGMLALSRRDLPTPKYRITRSTLWEEKINPWRHPERLPLLEGGLLGELIYADRPRIINDLSVDPDDPAAEYFAGHRSLLAIPNYDRGMSLNMVVILRHVSDGFDPEYLPEWVWMSNLFGRATHNLVLSDELKRAYALVDREMRVVADIQRSLLPARLPDIPGLTLAAHYETSSQAGGDYYDFFPMPDGTWGILVADVSGHGTPAAVFMAITHSIAHTYPGPATPPASLLDFVNHHLVARYTGSSSNFVTAFYGIYDPATRRLTYSCAGHNPPRVKTRGGRILSLEEGHNLPLGVEGSEAFENQSHVLEAGDELILYTDGITEAAAPNGALFSLERLDAVIAAAPHSPNVIVETILKALADFTAGRAPSDDRTLVVARVT